MQQEIQNILHELESNDFPHIPRILNYEEAEYNEETKTHTEQVADICINEAKENFEKIIATKSEDATFDNVVNALLNSDEKISLLYSCIYLDNSTNNNDTNNKVLQNIQTKVIELNNLSSFSKELYTLLSKIKEQELTAQQARSVELMMEAMEHKGIKLSEEKQEKLKKLSKEGAELGLKFQKNEIDSEKEFEYLITDEECIAEMPQQDKDAAHKKAEEAGKEGYLFTLAAPSIIAILTYCSDRNIREIFATALTHVASEDPFNNRKVILDILKNREEKAQIHSLSNYAEYAFRQKMAESAQQVKDVIGPLADTATQKAQQERQELMAFSGIEDFSQWDLRYYQEKLSQEKFQLTIEELRPYFEFENCVNGMFKIANEIFELKFEAFNPEQGYHEDVRHYKVYKDNTLIAYFMLDMFARKGKSSGAWCNTLTSRNIHPEEEDRLPIIYNMANFGKAKEGEKSLLTHDEVTTLFHEFGHATHCILSSMSYQSIVGFAIEWDAVEVPSQLFEEYAWEAESLQKFATHYQTGEVIPTDYIQKLQEKRSFMKGTFIARQASFIFSDIALHEAKAPTNLEELHTIHHQESSKYQAYPGAEPNYHYASFSHIFNGGYAAGYYSYIWADILVSDITKYIKEEGLFSQRTKEYRDKFLTPGASKKAAELFYDLMDRKPDSQAFIDQYMSSN